MKTKIETMKKELKDLKDTYFPFWEKMKDEILARDPYPSPEFTSELHSILNRAYMNALEVGFNEGCSFSLDQKEKDMEAFAEWLIGRNTEWISKLERNETSKIL